jgi:hypothetical protein
MSPERTYSVTLSRSELEKIHLSLRASANRLRGTDDEKSQKDADARDMLADRLEKELIEGMSQPPT